MTARSSIGGGISKCVKQVKRSPISASCCPVGIAVVLVAAAIIFSNAPSKVRAAAPAAVAQPKFEVGKQVDLLALIEPSRDSVGAAWRFEKGELVSPKEVDTFLEIPVTPPAAYRLTIVGQRDEGVDLFVGLTIGGSRVALVVDAFGKSACGLADIDGHFIRDNPTGRHFVNLLGDKRTYTVVCTVHPNSVIARVNGIPVVDWLHHGESISVPGHWPLPANSHLFIGGWTAVHRIRKITLETLPDDADIAAASRKEGIVKLVYQSPVAKPTVGWDRFWVNWIHADLWPFAITDETRVCSEFLFAPRRRSWFTRFPSPAAKYRGDSRPWDTAR